MTPLLSFLTKFEKIKHLDFKHPYKMMSGARTQVLKNEVLVKSSTRFPAPRPCFRFDGFRNPSIFSMDSESCWIIFSFLRIANPAEKSICQNIAGLKFNVWGEFPDGFFKMEMFPNRNCKNRASVNPTTLKLLQHL